MRNPWSGLSPRRRLLVGGAGVVVVAGLVAAVLTAAGSGTGPRGGPPAPDRPGPVLLVPGYGGGRDGLLHLADRIHRATGRDAQVLTLLGDGTGDLEQQAGVLADAVERAYADGAPSVDVIGYSAGGVVARLWVARDGGEHPARRVVTLGAPMHGTDLAAAGGALVPGACPTACQQLVPGSPLLRRLPPLPAGLPWLSVWTQRDETVTPPESARLEGAVNVALQGICPADTAAHGDLPTDPAITALVLRAIGPAPLRAPETCLSS
ncbi:lipase [Amycolatopsis sp. PS_44_ISF1]|uniref:esterase/lipase family protein n=1 Tax=Amycolatopsis sp. PS_44_ISF1 TaxID=2974917 RepID=UPI0028DE01FD|nr:lipase [Amycolatopsis sp. PS_44_ISF1]MDT8913355.1 lipase [Amycolatopsis sp. PS_44_ISF1]